MTHKYSPRPLERDFAYTNKAYARWMRAHPPTVRDDLRQRDNLVASTEKDKRFEIFRATFHRWAGRFPVVCAEVARGPLVVGVGDVHVCNFGVWPDKTGALCFGVNDFDEAAPMPYTNDLVRLLTSAALAAGELDLRAAAAAILTGYGAGLRADPKQPFELGPERHPVLLQLVDRKLAEDFWSHLYGKHTRALADDELDTDAARTARAAVIEAASDGPVGVDLRGRTAGCGSLGRERVVAIANQGAGAHGEGAAHLAARETKRLLPSAWMWAHVGNPESPSTDSGNPFTTELLALAASQRDPLMGTFGEHRYVQRALAPDRGRLLFDEAHLSTDVEVLEAMAFALGLVHQVSAPADRIQADLTVRANAWLESSARAMHDDLVRDVRG